MRRPNIILLSVDALRVDHLGYHGYRRETSPFLDSLSERVARFETAISASSHTREAVPALLSGQYPIRFAANDYRATGYSAADRLSAAGFQTAGFHSNPYISRAYGFDSGFDVFDDDLRLGRSRFVALAQRFLDKFVLNRGEYHARAEKINERAIEWLDRRDLDRPFFLWNHYMDVHGPYNPPKGYTFADERLSNSDAHDLYQKCINESESLSDTERRLLVDNYDGEIRYLDEQLSDLFDELGARGLLDSSLVVVTADHGEGLGDHGYFTHPRRLHESLIHVPLLVWIPGGSPRRIPSPVSTLDIVPTMFDWADLDADDLPGTSLLDDGRVSVDGRSDAVYASVQGEDEHANVRRFVARDERWKVHLSRDVRSGQVVDEVAYDLEDDPDESQPISRYPDAVRSLRRELERWSEERLEREFTETESETADSTEVDQRLEALGYR
jgi:arylsulfatase